MTEDYIFNPKGFSEGFSIHLLKVKEFDSTGLPKKYKDSLRVDLEFKGFGEIKKTIWFNKQYPNYYWTKALSGKYSTIPIRFEQGNWYGIWGNFKSGPLKTTHHNFFLFKDAKGARVFEKTQEVNF